MNISAAAVTEVLMLFAPTLAQEHQHPDATYSGALGQFYETWMRPNNPKSSCCNRQDCSPVTAIRHLQGMWQAQRADGQWLNIPNYAIEQRRDSPDGRSHVCAIGLSVICFVFGSGT